MKRQSVRERAARLLLSLLLVLALAWTFFPVLFTAVSSIKQPNRIWSYPPSLAGPYTLRNYADLFTQRPEYLGQLLNSLIITAGTVLLTLACSVPAAFAFSRYRHSLLKLPAFFLLAIRMLPPIVITIPLFPLLNRLGLLDRHVTLIVLYSAFVVSLGTWMMKTFIDDIPAELEESAMIDGCSRIQSFWVVTLPLIAPGIVAVIIFVAIDVWNEYLFAFTFTSSKARTAPTGIAEIMGALMGVEWGMLLAATIVQLLPVLVFVWLIQKRLVKGMTVGGIKG